MNETNYSMQIRIKQISIKFSLCLFVLISIFMLTCCSKEETTPELYFSVSVSQIEDFSATVIVTHTGTNRDAYYAIAVKGYIEDVYAEIDKHHNDIGSQNVVDVPYDQKKRVVKLQGLLPDTDYTCIVYGVDDSGNIKGVPAKTSFKTTSSSIVFEKNSKWKITYQGQDKYNDKTYSKIIISVQGDVEERFFVRVFNKNEIENLADARSIILQAYNDFINERNETEDENFWIDDRFVATGSIIYYKYLYKGSYQAYVIGVDANGRLTGHYANSEEFEFDRYELDPEYAYLIGDWEITDEVGESILFSLSEKWANSTLTMSGWGYNDCPLTMNYNPSGTYILSIPGQSANGCAWEKDETTTMTLRPWYLNEEGKLRIYTSSIVTSLARAKRKNEDGTFTFSRAFNIKLDNGEYANTNGIILTFYDEVKSLHYYNSSKIQLPFTMKKIE